MTEKRFKSNCKLGLVNGEEPLCKCLLDNGKPKSYREWVDLLNNLIEENEQLKEENGDLNEEIMGYDSFVLLYKEQRDELKEENNRLKQFKQKAFEIINKTIERETIIAENIEKTTHSPPGSAINRGTISTLENLKMELEE